MSTPYQGTPANVAVGLAATINGATNATPIVIATTASHLYSTGDTVSITGVGGNTAANGTWVIIVTDATHFSLTGSVGSGAYTSGGTATDQFLTPPFQIPSDGDPRNSASVNAAFQMLADRTQFLASRCLQRSDLFTATGTWTCPAGVTRARLRLVGPGGGGGGAGGSTGNGGGGAAGGGAGALVTLDVTVVPGTVYTVTAPAGGAGGAGGAASTNGSNGTDGADTTFGALATARGGQGGSKGHQNGDANTYAEGGRSPTSGDAPLGTTIADITATTVAGTKPLKGQGGWGWRTTDPGARFTGGGPGAVGDGAAGGTGGPVGAATGAGGGGGGASDWFGMAPGAGGNGSASTTGGAGSAGTMGAGGGGGGGGGGAVGIGGAGGAGGAGRCEVTYFGPQAGVT